MIVRSIATLEAEVGRMKLKKFPKIGDDLKKAFHDTVVFDQVPDPKHQGSKISPHFALLHAPNTHTRELAVWRSVLAQDALRDPLVEHLTDTFHAFKGAGVQQFIAIGYAANALALQTSDRYYEKYEHALFAPGCYHNVRHQVVFDEDQVTSPSMQSLIFTDVAMTLTELHDALKVLPFGKVSHIYVLTNRSDSDEIKGIPIVSMVEGDEWGLKHYTNSKGQILCPMCAEKQRFTCPNYFLCSRSRVGCVGISGKPDFDTATCTFMLDSHGEATDADLTKIPAYDRNRRYRQPKRRL